jgi:archaeal flagellar protein FlaI
MVELKKNKLHKSEIKKEKLSVKDSGLKKLSLFNPKDNDNYKNNSKNHSLSKTKEYVPKKIVFKKLDLSKKNLLLSANKISKEQDKKRDQKTNNLDTGEILNYLKSQLPKDDLTQDSKEVTDLENTKKSESVDDLLDELSSKTKDMDQDNSISIEQISFLDDSPKLKKMFFKDHNVSNLYSKIDSLEKQTNLEEDRLNKLEKNRNLKENNLVKDQKDSNNSKGQKLKKFKVIPLIEQFDIPSILSLKDKTNFEGTIFKKGFFIMDDIKLGSDQLRPNNFIKDKNSLKLNPEIDKKREQIKKEKAKKKEDKKQEKKDITNIIVNSKELYDDVSDFEKKSNSKEIIPNTKKLSLDKDQNRNSDKENSIISTSSVSNNSDTNQKVDENEVLKKKNSLLSGTKETGFSHLLPSNKSFSDSKEISQKFIRSGIQSKTGSVIKSDFENKAKTYPELVYTIKSSAKNFDYSSVYEKYNIDELSYVTIFYDNVKGLCYNIVQPELTAPQEKIFLDIKKHFLDSIDQNYFSFKGDKENIRKYIRSIFDITIVKLSYNLSSLDKKMYFSFIERDVSGLGFLYNLLNDKNVLEVTCPGEKTAITVYHIKYGVLQTNLEFESIPKLNLFVLSLTKIMGLHVNSNQPVISGHLPNGYKVEGLYSVGDISNRGSSFIIKKYLEEPLTPVTLMTLGIGSIDIFSYIWSAIDEGYQIVFTGEEENSLITNTVAQFYPDKKIISVQSVDNLTLAQKNWIKRISLEDTQVSKKLILTQSISEKPDYLILDQFTEEFFDTQWYNLNMLSVDNKLIDTYCEKAKSISSNLLLIDLKRIKQSKNQQQTQFNKIKEIYKGKEYEVIDFNSKDLEFRVNLLSSNIDLAAFSKKKKLLRWLLDSKITNYKDFNSVINDYYLDPNNLFEKIGLKES